MYDGDHFHLMARYNRWMNRKLYAVCAEMSDVQRKRDLGAFFRSIHGTLNHLLYGDMAWMARFTGNPVDVDLDSELFAEFGALRDARARKDREIVDWADALDPDWLAAPFEYTSKVDGSTRLLPAWVLVDHMFNHQTHHRGQVTTLIKQLGHEPGVTDLPWLPELEAER